MILYYLIVITFFVLLGIVFFINQFKTDAKKLDKLGCNINKLNGMIYCAKSDCDCNKAYEYKKDIEKIQNNFDLDIKNYNKLLKKYYFRYAFISLIASKINVKNPDEFKLNC